MLQDIDSFTMQELCGGDGGVSVLLKDRVQINNIMCDTRETFELMDVRFRSSLHLSVFVIYWPPESTYVLFCREFSRLLDTTLPEHPGPIIFIGDINFHFDDPNDHYARRFANILGYFDLKQHVRGITHKDGHTLHLVITKSDDSLIKNIRVCDSAISDHRAIHWGLFLEKPSCVCQENCSFP